MSINGLLNHYEIQHMLFSELLQVLIYQLFTLLLSQSLTNEYVKRTDDLRPFQSLFHFFFFFFQINMAWSSNRFCDFGGRLNRYAQGLQNTTRNGCTVTKSNSSTASSGGLAVSKLQSLRAGTTAVSLVFFEAQKKNSSQL